MQLTDDEKAMLDGTQGAGKQKAMELLSLATRKLWARSGLSIRTT